MPKKTTEELSYERYNSKGAKMTRGHLVVPVVDISDYKELIAQAVRVFLANQRQGTLASKSRGEVEGSTRKIYKQKGTGRARHGDIKAGIFVGGGIIFGPKPRDFELKLNKKMKRKAFSVAILDKILNNKFIVIDGISKLPIRTKEFYNLFQKIFSNNIQKERILFINNGNKNVRLSVRNIPFITLVSANTVNTYEILTHSVVLTEKSASDKLFNRVGILVQRTIKKKISKK